MWEPQGPLPQEIYRRRRIAAAGVAFVVLLIVIVVVAVSCSGGSDEQPSAAAAATTTDTAAEAGATASPAATTTTAPAGEAPQPAGTPAPSGTPAPDDTVPGGQCSDAAIGLTVQPEQANYTAGDPVTFITTVTNIGSVPCVRDLSGPLVVNTVATVDGTQVWSNADCFPGTGSDIRTLKPGEQAQFKMVWAGTSSSGGCAPDQRQQLPAGVYAVTSHLGAMVSKPVPFNIH